MVRSIITYGAEIWGSAHIKFHKVNSDYDFESCYDKTVMTVWLLDILSIFYMFTKIKQIWQWEGNLETIL